MRDRHAPTDAAPPVLLALSQSRVERISKAFAAQIILRYEWLGTMTGSQYHYGLFFGPFCAGVTCVVARGGSGLARNAHKAFAVPQPAVALLARGACVSWAPHGANSRLVAWTARLLAKDTDVKVLLAYADTDAGEIGTIYQACGWAYLGGGSSCKQYVAPNGRIWNNLTFTGWAARQRLTIVEGRDRLTAAGWRVEHASAKHRYAVVIDKTDQALVDRVEAMKQAYPKRGRSVESDAPGYPPGEGGAMPTRPLLSSGAVA